MGKENYSKLVIYHLLQSTESQKLTTKLNHLNAALGILLGYAKRNNEEEISRRIKEDIELIKESLTAVIALKQGHAPRVKPRKYNVLDELSARSYLEELSRTPQDAVQEIYNIYSDVHSRAYSYMVELGLGEGIDILDLSELIDRGITKKATQKDEEDDDTY